MLALLVALSAAFWNPELPRNDGEALRAKLIENVQQFELRLVPYGPSGKPYYTVALSVPALRESESTGFTRASRISVDQARRIIDRLAELNWLDGRRLPGERIQSENGYTLQLVAGDVRFERDIGWDLEMLESLDSLQTLLDGEAAKNMDFLLTRMSGLRRVWQTAHDSAEQLEASVHRPDSSVTIQAEGPRVVLDIASASGIGQATIRRKGEAWPKAMTLRMRLHGMESLRVSAGETALEWNVTSGGELVVRQSLIEHDRQGEIRADSPLWGEVRIVGEDKTVPLESGYFEVTLPAKLLETQADELKIRWIDFYR